MLPYLEQDSIYRQMKVNGTADNLEKSLRSDIDDKNAQIDDLNSELANERKFSSAVAPAVVKTRFALCDSNHRGIRTVGSPAWTFAKWTRREASSS